MKLLCRVRRHRGVAEHEGVDADVEGGHRGQHPPALTVHAVLLMVLFSIMVLLLVVLLLFHIFGIGESE